MKLVIALCVLGGVASAEPAAKIDLELAHEPGPKRLRMRRPAKHTATADGTITAPEPAPAGRPATPPPAPDATPPRPLSEAAAGVRDPAQPVAFRINLGYVVDGAASSGTNNAGQPLTGSPEYATLRSYGFGEVYGATHGLGVQSISSYLAARFLLSDHKVAADGNDLAPPIATWFDRSTYEIRSAWGEAKDFLPEAWLSPLRVRAGRQYVYGPWVSHMDGVNVAWEGRIVNVQAYAGTNVPDFLLPGEPADRSAVSGVSAHADLRRLASPVPVSFGLEAFRFAGHDTAELEADWRPAQDFALIAQARTLDGNAANEHVQFRGHYRQVSNLVIDVLHRHATDWRWDPSAITLTDPTAPRSYLQLGPVLPQVIASIRGGTVIAENVDLLLRAAASADLSGDATPKSSFSATYLELGGALEVRLRRTLAVGASVLNRDTERASEPVIADAGGTALPLPMNLGALGENGFTEIGTSVRLSFGARKFSAELEVCGRRTRYAQIYELENTDGSLSPIPQTDLRGGGRVTVDAWINDRLRLFGAYDLSSSLSIAPEITGYKSLKLMIEGVY